MRTDGQTNMSSPQCIFISIYSDEEKRIKKGCVEPYEGADFNIPFHKMNSLHFPYFNC